MADVSAIPARPKITGADAAGSPGCRIYGVCMGSPAPFTSAIDAAYDPRILLFGRLLAAANGFEYLLAKELEEATGLTHPIFELLLIVARAGEEGTSVKDIAQARVVTSGGATRLVSRAVEQGLVERQGSTGDRRVQLVRLTDRGKSVLLEAAEVHAQNIERHVMAALPPESEPGFSQGIRALSRRASLALPVMP